MSLWFKLDIQIYFYHFNVNTHFLIFLSKNGPRGFNKKKTRIILKNVREKNAQTKTLGHYPGHSGD